MDLMYLSESLGYQSRVYSFGHSEQSWVNINENSGKPKKEKINCTKDGKNCSICKSRQKRILGDYIRKTRRDSDRETFIEEEEEEVEQKEKEEEKPVAPNSKNQAPSK